MWVESRWVSAIQVGMLFSHVRVHCEPVPAINVAAWHCNSPEVTWPTHPGPTHPGLDRDSNVSSHKKGIMFHAGHQGRDSRLLGFIIWSLPCHTDKQTDLVEATCSCLFVVVLKLCWFLTLKRSLPAKALWLVHHLDPDLAEDIWILRQIMKWLLLYNLQVAHWTNKSTLSLWKNYFQWPASTSGPTSSGSESPLPQSRHICSEAAVRLLLGHLPALSVKGCGCKSLSVVLQYVSVKCSMDEFKILLRHNEAKGILHRWWIWNGILDLTEKIMWVAQQLKQISNCQLSIANFNLN